MAAMQGFRIPRSRLSAAAEHGFDARLRQVLLLQLARQGNSHSTTCSERVAALLMDYLDVPLPWHPEQPHLAEWQALSAREVLLNFDSTVEAKNMAQLPPWLPMVGLHGGPEPQFPSVRARRHHWRDWR